MVVTMDEFALIDCFTKPFRPRPSPQGPGDDAALLPLLRKGVVTTDTLHEGVHFRRSTFSLADIGHKALAVNLSDLAAMGATPRGFLCALAFPQSFGAKELRALASGMAALARKTKTQLVGGNVCRAAHLSITITAFGEAPRPLLRSGARPGDLLCVSGPLGQAAAGLELLEAGVRSSPLITAQRRPTPALTWAQVAAPYLSAAMDVSDGLVQDVGHLCRASKLSAELDVDSIPMSKALRAYAGTRALALALGGGEDYVLLATVPKVRRPSLLASLRRRGLTAHFIGNMRRGPPKVLLPSWVPKVTGYSHFG